MSVNTEIIKVQEECDFCDGCGWYEGGITIMTTCEKCEGTGSVEVEREVPIRHRWVLGIWQKEIGKRYWVRDDHCSLCDCGRGMVRSSKNSDDQFIAHYYRSGQIFGNQNMPECWGAKNPQ